MADSDAVPVYVDASDECGFSLVPKNQAGIGPELRFRSTEGITLVVKESGSDTQLTQWTRSIRVERVSLGQGVTAEASYSANRKWGKLHSGKSVGEGVCDVSVELELQGEVLLDGAPKSSNKI